MPEQYKVVPFTALLKQGDTSGTVSSQMQSVIDKYTIDDWKYSHMDGVQTFVAGNAGCFGIGATASYNTTYNVLIFKKE